MGKSVVDLLPTFVSPTIVMKSISSLRPHPQNARTHSKHQIRQIAESMRSFGYTSPVIIDREDQIIAGHGRVEAAKLIGTPSVPTICLADLTNDQIRAYMLADNKIAQNAGWDQEVLKVELGYLLTLDVRQFDATITGFEIPEIDAIVSTGGSASTSADFLSEMECSGPSVSVHSDCWELRKHRLYCGNALEEDAYDRLMLSRKASVVFCDVPYNVATDGHATGNGRIKHRQFKMASGEMSDPEFTAFLAKVIGHLIQYSKEPSIHYICMDWRHVENLIAACKERYGAQLNICVWVKNQGGMGSFYRSQYELIFVYRNGKTPHKNNIQLGKYGRNRTNVWQYPGVQTMSRQGDEGNLLALHPTVKPIAMVADAILDSSARGEIVLDAFLGSGTTLLAAERVGRVCYGMEIDPLYVDTAIRRWQKYTGESAIHAVSGRSFDEIAQMKESLHD